MSARSVPLAIRSIARYLALIVRLTIVSLSAGLAGPPAAKAEQTIALELMGGSAVNFPTPLNVHQDGYPDINVSAAHYDTKPFGPESPYYAWRISDWNDDTAWEIAQIHHRLFLSNPPPEIQFFAIHYGYNYFFVGRGWKWDGFVFHLGVGPIVTNPQNTVRNQVWPSGTGGIFNSGYFFSGIGAEAAAEKYFYFAKHWFIVVEGALTPGWAWSVPVVNGHADVPNLALHGHIGVGFNF
ncbi:MAG TPA: hypothetical protein VK437_09160 [Steroidobacteraceae bacterium]|nr:hypothetical protein [Steroidobacteraceae bacterium]